jgi:hypothetical protein
MSKSDLIRISVTASPEELEVLRKKAKNCGLPLSRYLVLKALNKLARE